MYTTFAKYINILFPVSNKNYRMHFVNIFVQFMSSSSQQQVIILHISRQL